jgi:hypothetical protein
MTLFWSSKATCGGQKIKSSAEYVRKGLFENHACLAAITAQSLHPAKRPGVFHPRLAARRVQLSRQVSARDTTRVL